MASKNQRLPSPSMIQEIDDKNQILNIARICRNILESEIDKANIAYGSVKEQIKRSIAIFINGNVISISADAIVPSIYYSVGIPAGTANLTNLYNYGWEINHDQLYYNPSYGFMLNKVDSTKGHPATNFLQAAKDRIEAHFGLLCNVEIKGGR